MGMLYEMARRYDEWPGRNHLGYRTPGANYWGYQGCAKLRYDDWLANGQDMSGLVGLVYRYCFQEELALKRVDGGMANPGYFVFNY